MNPQHLQLGVVAATFGTDAREAARAARSAGAGSRAGAGGGGAGGGAGGFDGLLFDAFAPSLDLTALSQTGRREFRQVLASSNEQLVGLSVDVGIKGFGPGADVDRLLSQFDKVMETAKGLGAPLVCVEAGPLPEPAIAAPPKPKVTQEQAGLILLPEPAKPAEPSDSRPVPGPDAAVVAHIDDALSALGSRADRVGVTLAFRSDLASFAALDRVLSAARCPWFGVDLDPVAVARDGWPIDEVFSRLGPLARHVRARDASVGSDHRTRPAVIGRGSVEWEVFLSNLDAAGYRGWVTIDPLELPDRPAGAVAGAAFVRSLVSPSSPRS